MAMVDALEAQIADSRKNSLLHSSPNSPAPQ
jgi:hypothetical protein